VVVLVLHALINIFGSHLVAMLNNVSVYWHVVGVVAVVAILAFAPVRHQSFAFVFTERINNSGFSDGTYWFYVLPLGFLLTQYTITGFDACAHISEETKGAARTAARGIWQSILYSAIGGWVLLLAFLFAATNVDEINKQAGFVGSIITTALNSNLAIVVIGISAIGQFFCGMSCVTSTSRMSYAFSRDGAVPGHRLWSRLNANRVPVNAVIGSCVAGLILTLPALYKSSAGVPTAFYAVVSVAVIGLYLAFLIPIALRLRAGDSFVPGPWTLGRNYKWMCWTAIIEIVIISVYFILPTVPAGVPGAADFSWTAVNYAPLAVGGLVLLIAVWWFASARKWFTGPKHTIEI
jgi:amino acid transporter